MSCERDNSRKICRDAKAPSRRSKRGTATSPAARELRRLFELNERQLKPRSAFRRELERNLKMALAKRRPAPKKRGGRSGMLRAP